MLKTTLTLLFVTLLLTNSSIAQEDVKYHPMDSTIVETRLGEIQISGYNYSSENRSHVQISIVILYDLGIYKEGVIQEAEVRNLSRDVVYVEFVQDSSCQVVDIRIFKSGILNSFNEFAAEWCTVFKEKLSEINDSVLVGKNNEYYECDSSFRMPLKLILR